MSHIHHLEVYTFIVFLLFLLKPKGTGEDGIIWPAGLMIFGAFELIVIILKILIMFH